MVPFWLTLLFMVYVTFIFYHWGWFAGYAYRSDQYRGDRDC